WRSATSRKFGSSYACCRHLKTPRSSRPCGRSCARSRRTAPTFTRSRVQHIYDAAYADGRRAAENDKPPQFHEVTPWRDMVAEIRTTDESAPWLKPHERGFIEDMSRWCQRRDPTEKQGNWIHILWVRARRRR